MEKVRVFHADDHVGFSDKLREILEPEVDWLGAVHDAEAVVSTVAGLVPDVVLLDISMPRKSGLELAREIVHLIPGVRIIMVSVHGEPAYLKEAFAAGASGYVVKSAVASEISAAVHEVHAGRTFVSKSLARGGAGDFTAGN